MNIENTIENKIKVFHGSVNKHFDFLIKLGFSKESLKSDFEDPRDRRVEISYISNELCIIIQWFMSYANIGVGIIKLENGKIPRRYSFYGSEGYGAAISLLDLVEYLTDGDYQRLLPQHNNKSSVAEIARKWQERGQIIEKELDHIISEYALLLREYARNILDGDFSIFPEVQNYAQSKLPN